MSSQINHALSSPLLNGARQSLSLGLPIAAGVIVFGVASFVFSI